MASDMDRDVDDDIVCRMNSLLDIVGNRAKHAKHVEDIRVEHFVLLYRHVTGEAIPGSTNISSIRDEARVAQVIIDSLADDIFGIPMDHMTGTGIVTGNRRMVADLIEIFSSIVLQPDVVEEEESLEETVDLDKIPTPMRDVLVCLHNEVECLAKSAMLQNLHPATIQKFKDAFSQTTPVSKTTAMNSPIIWKDVFQTLQGSCTKAKQHPKQHKQMSKVTCNYLTQSYRPSRKVLTPKPGLSMSNSTRCLSKPIGQMNVKTRMQKATDVSRTTSTSCAEVHPTLRNQPELDQKRDIFNEVLEKVWSTGNRRLAPAQKRSTAQSKDKNNNIQKTSVYPCKPVRPSSSEVRRRKPQNQRPMNKVIKPKPVLSSKVRRKSSTGSTSTIYPSHNTSLSSQASLLRKSNPGHYTEKMIELTDKVKAIRDRQQEINKQMSQLQKENESLQQLETLIIKEIRLTKAIEDRKRRPRGISVL